MRAPVTICSKRAASDDVNRRERSLEVKHGHSTGRRMPRGCGAAPDSWRAGCVRIEQRRRSSVSRMRAHFTMCPKRPAASEQVGPDEGGT